VRGEDTLAGWRGGWGGVNFLEDARHSSVIYICKYFVGMLNLMIQSILKNVVWHAAIG
jgi:hypothetical protein